MHILTRQSMRRGLTLVEALIALAAVVLIAAIFLPAIQQTREAARRTQCKNNLKQLGIAMHNYLDTYNLFPSGFIVGEQGIYQGWGWGLMIQPFLDSSPYYSGLNFSAGLQTDYALPHMNPYIPSFRCPSAPGSDRVEHAFVISKDIQNGVVTTATVDAANIFSRTNYFAMAGYLHSNVGGIKYDSSGEPPASGPHINAGSLGHFGTSPDPGLRYCDPSFFRGIFAQNTGTRIKDIKDGLPNVIMIGERAIPSNNAKNAIGHGTWLGVPDCTTAAGLAMTLGDSSIKMNSALNRQAETTGFGSMHSGGAFFLFADGSVKFLSERISMAVYRDLSTIDDGRKIPNFE